MPPSSVANTRKLHTTTALLKMPQESPPSELQAFFADHKRIDWNELSKREEKGAEKKSGDKKGGDKKSGDKKGEDKKGGDKNGGDKKGGEKEKKRSKPCRVLIKTDAGVPIQSLYFFIGGERKLSGIHQLFRSDGNFHGDWLVSLINKAVIPEIRNKGLLHGVRVDVYEI